MVRIWGHRGCRGPSNPPENSLAAFAEAIKQGADGFELDVFLTKDNKLVVFHDDTLESMTDGSGPITDYYLEQLKSLRLKDAKGELTDERIPALDDVLALVDRLRVTDPERAKNFTVNIEIKKMPEGKVTQVVRAIRSRLQKGWTADNFQVSSFDMKSLENIQRPLPEVPIGVLFAGPEKPWDMDEEQLREAIATMHKHRVRPSTINLTLRSITPTAVKMIRDAGAQPVAWTVDEPHPEMLMQEPDAGAATARRILSSDLHAMISDYPKEMRTLLDKFASRKSAVKR